MRETIGEAEKFKANSESLGTATAGLTAIISMQSITSLQVLLLLLLPGHLLANLRLIMELL